MLIKTRGIIFKSVKYSESSLILDIYTENLGLQKYIISGVRTKKAKTQASLLQVMSLVDLVAYYRENKSLNRIKEVRPAYIFTNLPFDVRRSAIGQFMTEIARKSIKEAEKNQPLFQFLFDSFVFLDKTPQSVANLHLLFIIALTYFLGFTPGGDYSDQTPFFDLKEGMFLAQKPDHPHFMSAFQGQCLDLFLNADREQCHQIAISREDRAKILRLLIDFYRLHIENFPTIFSHEILEEVLG